MQQGLRQMDRAMGWSGNEPVNGEALAATAVRTGVRGESLAEVAHDARNMVTALGFYCELLEEPGVLTESFRHYGTELRLVASASRRLMDKLMALETRTVSSAASGFETLHDLGAHPDKAPSASRTETAQRWEMLPAEPIANLAAEVQANRNLLSALSGPAITVTVSAVGGELPVRLTGEDLTRLLVNLVKNAAEAMPAGGDILIGVQERSAVAGAEAMLALTVEDNGPGIPREALERIFESGYTTHAKERAQNGSWPATHRGLGLSIARSIVEEAGGRIQVSNRAPFGARFEIELPSCER